MRKKLKLAFDELEKELTIITQAELMQLMGGNGSGLSANASIEEVASYLQGIGVPLTQDSSGNYFFNSSGNSIMIEEVVVMGYSTGMSSSGNEQSGYSSGTSEEMTPLDMVVSYLQSYGYSFVYNNGNYTYQSNNNNNSNSNSDPWKRDSNGKIITTDVPGKQTSVFSANHRIDFQEVTINGTDVIAYRVIGVSEKHEVPNGIAYTALSSIPDRFMSNCTGFAFGDGQLWFNDPYDPTLRDVTVNEYQGFINLVTNTSNNSNPPYSSVEKGEANMAIIWTTGGQIWHAAQVDSNGNYVQKYGDSNIQTSSSESEFFNSSIQTNDPNNFRIEYYKKNF